MTEKEYLQDPCGVSSLPYWKTEKSLITPGVTVVREDGFRADNYAGTDERYFKAVHDLVRFPRPDLPPGCNVVSCGADEAARHINVCYSSGAVTLKEMRAYARRPVYDPGLWIAVRDESGIIASGIAERDDRIGEGILEWVQVSPDHRRGGLGRFVVCELLRRLKGRAAFVTVSGRLDDPNEPLRMYRSCGFRDPVVWHVIRGGQNGAG